MTEIPAGPTWPTQWRLDQTPGSGERGAVPLIVAIGQHTNTRLIRLYIEFTPGPGFPPDDLNTYKEQDGVRYASRYVNRQTLLDNLGALRPGGRQMPLARPPSLPRVMETMIWGRDAGRGRIDTLVAVHIANGPGGRVER